DYDGFGWGLYSVPFRYGGASYPDLSRFSSASGLEQNGQVVEHTPASKSSTYWMRLHRRFHPRWICGSGLDAARSTPVCPCPTSTTPTSLLAMADRTWVPTSSATRWPRCPPTGRG